MTIWRLSSQATNLVIATTDIDNAQFGIPYSFTLRATNSDTVTNPLGFQWAGGQGLPAGLSLSSAGVISGVTYAAPGVYNVTVTCTQTIANGFGTNDAAVKSFTLLLVGRLDMDSGAASAFTTTINNDSSGPKPIPQSVDSGANNVAVWQFVLHAHGEDIRLTSLTFHGLGQGSDTFDIIRAKLYIDVNSNAKVDSADVFLPSAQTFITTVGFNPSVTFSNIGFIVDIDQDQGFETFLVAYDFRSSVEAGRTFRLAMEGSGDISWTTLGTNVSRGTSLSGGDINSQGRDVITAWTQMTSDTAIAGGIQTLSNGLPFKSNIITILGPTPIQATLNVTPGVFAPAPLNVAAGAVTQAALGFRLYTDSSHTIIVDQIIMDDSGSGISDLQLTEAKLFYDLDASGTFSANDLLLRTSTFVQDRVTFSNLSLLVRTPSGLPTDASAVNLLVTYSFSSNIPVLSPPLTFQPQFFPTSQITAHEVVSGLPVVVTGAGIVGNVFSVVAGTLSSLTIDSGPVALATQNIANNDTRVVVWQGRFYADSGHAISLNALRFTPSGNLDDRFDITTVSLVKDRDNTGTFTSGDLTLATGTYAADNDTIILTISTPEIIRTPTGTATDSNAINLLLMYALNGNAPVTVPPISFSAKLTSTNDVFAKVYNAGESISFIGLNVVSGRTSNITSAPAATSAGVGFGPFPISATIADNDTSGTATQGDDIILAFDTNLLSTSSATKDRFTLPVVGDDLGINPTITFIGGNKMRIRMGATPVITVPGAYATGVHVVGSPSGINLKDTLSTIFSTYNVVANPAATAVDVGGAVGDTSSTAGPTLISAIYSDADSSFTINIGDQLILTFSSNIVANAVPATAFTPLPVTGDFLGSVAPAISQTAGNQLTMTFTSVPILKITGTYVAGTHAAGSPSGINLVAITASIVDTVGRSARPSAVAVDIGGSDTGSQNLAPMLTGAVYQDVDSSASVNAGDVLDLSFSGNVTHGHFDVSDALPINTIFMPVVGDIIDFNSVVSRVDGNKVRLTLAGTTNRFRVSGVFSAAVTTESSPSGINLLSPNAGLRDLAGRPVVPAPAPVDIVSGTPNFNDAPGTTATTSPDPNAPTAGPAPPPGGAKACVLTRNVAAHGFFELLRAFRDGILESSLGRFLTGVYYAL